MFLEISSNYEDFLVSSIDRLDSLIDLDFQRTLDQSQANAFLS